MNTNGSSEEQILRAVERLVVKQGTTLGSLPRADMLLTLAMASLVLPASGVFSEAEVNRLLKAWLADDGSMLRIDHVELRRTLIDLRFWTRDGYGHAYQRSLLSPDHLAHDQVVALQSIHVSAFVADVRARNAERRARHREAHAAEGSSGR